MHYFNKVKINDEVFSLIYGKGKVVMALPKKQRVDGFYVFEVTYKKKISVHYTLEGYPNWCTLKGGCQTVFYLEDIDITDMDIQPSNKLLSKKQILKFKDKGTLEVRCPSGIWRNVDTIPLKIFKKAFTKEQLYLFRKELDV